ncbi:helix-turn-helix domain-containing protein [Methylobacterium nodulans]|uniref:Transcriptional regulator, XRE family n=1 Tax=Methylobacterium nodulans (strain LMG 21967 / CNCM I-2342 / ORS 2060) TaxID=460265 RepID=B8INT1_METNO|nr:helix-turn-helix domain-containing protein [Methylobacterium nodulans]ACL58447.1 transcriptional regulator, XRE family [Methylobacterium nodulans ORS 2060]
MTKRVFEDIKAGLEEAIAIAQGDIGEARIHVPSSIDVRGLRKRLGLTQGQFADRYGFSIGAVRDWEQGRATPEGATRAFLLVIEREPEAVERALRAA